MIRSCLAILHRCNTKSTIARKLSAVRVFLKYLVQRQIVPVNIAEQILTPKRERPLPVYLSVDEMFRLLDSSLAGICRGCGAGRFLKPCIPAGFEFQSWFSWMPTDVNAISGMIRVTGKGSKQRRFRSVQGACCDSGLSSVTERRPA